MSKRVVIFGGSGFIGSHVADILTDAGYHVVIYDKKKSSYLRDTQEIIMGDVLDLTRVKEAVKDADYVYNFSGIADIGEAKIDPLQTIKMNILGNSHILEAARLNNVKRFIFASSLYVYSELGSFYRSSKQACELIIEDFHKKYGLDYTILRYGSLYGGRADDHNFIHRAIKQALLEGKVTRKGNGEEIREYIHVLDAARCSVEILSDEYKNQIAMITGLQKTKIKDLLNMIKETLGDKVVIEYVDDTDDEHYTTTPYTFKPRVAQNYALNKYCDLSEGVLGVFHSVHEELTKQNKCLQIDFQNLK
ncbi:MAG: NAD(P)-dependent oxidoreductase [Candidatus Omnitrophica bacterium]|nr:NAD(P)-dependent oxidoreductase [Candidatus Omnitrophota bacterium]